MTLAIVERELVGGECPYWGCVPSKTLLRSGETLTEADRARRLAASEVQWSVDFPKVSKRVLWMARDLDDSRPAAALEATGAKLVRGEGKLVDLRAVEVSGERLVARRAIVIVRIGRLRTGVRTLPRGTRLHNPDRNRLDRRRFPHATPYRMVAARRGCPSD